MLAFTGLYANLHAVPAYPGKITVTQTDGSKLDIYLHGDEFFHYATTSEGYNIIQGEDKSFYYARLDGMRLVSSGIRVNSASRSGAQKVSMSQIQKGVPQSVIAARSSQRRAQMNSSANALSSAATSRASSTIQTKMLVILVSFSDVPFTTTNPRQSFDDLLNKEGYSANGATGSVRDYYYDNTNGKYAPQFDVVGPYKLSHNTKYYGGNDDDGDDSNARQMIIDACTAADADVDFSKYSSGNYIDNIYVVYAGYNEAEGGEDDTVWPHKWSVSGEHKFDGKQLAGYACTSELKGSSGDTMASIGTFCHEFGHTLDLPDFYDTEYSGENVHPASFSLMASGSYNNGGRTPAALSAIERNIISSFLAGEKWATIMTIEEGHHTLEPLQTGKAYRIDTPNTGEYFILENRTPSYKWDQYLSGGTRPLSASDGGLVVWHVDQSNNIMPSGSTAASLWASGYDINTEVGHECYKIVRAKEDLEIKRYNSALYAAYEQWIFPNSDNSVTSLNESNDDFKLWGRGYNNHIFSNITRNGQNVEFDLSSKSTITLYGQAKNLSRNGVEGASVFAIPYLTSALRVESTEGLMRLTARTETTATKSVAGEKYSLTDKDGKFSIADMAKGEYDLYISKEGYADHHEHLKLTASTPDIAAQLSAPKQSKTIYKTWCTRENGQFTFNTPSLLIAAEYNLSDLGTSAKQVELLGADFKITVPGLYIIHVYKNRKSVATKSFTVEAGALSSYNYVDLKSLNVTMTDTEEVMVAVELNSYSGTLYAYTDASGFKGSYYSTNGGTSWQKATDDDDNYIQWAIGADFGSYTAAEQITFDNASTSLKAGDYEKVRYTLTPANSTGEIKWTSDNQDVAAVDENGVVMAQKKGVANITATLDGAKSSTFKVTVTDTEITSISAPVLNTAETEASLSWTSDSESAKWYVRWKGTWDEEYSELETDTKSAKISGLQNNSTYEVEIRGERKYKPELFWGAAKATFKTSDKPMAERVDISRDELELDMGETFTLTASVYPADVWNTELVWSSSDEKVATVSNSGIVKAVAKGTATIKAKTRYGDTFAECAVTVGNSLEVAAYQNGAYITWQKRDWTGNWEVTIMQGSNVIENRKVTDNSYYCQKLLPNTTYNVTIKGDGEKSLTFTTAKAFSQFAHMDGIKGTYSTDEQIQLKVGGIKIAISSVVWSIDGTVQELEAPTLTLPAGEHTIVVAVTTDEGTEYVRKVVVVQ